MVRHRMDKIKLALKQSYYYRELDVIKYSCKKPKNGRYMTDHYNNKGCLLYTSPSPRD